MQVGTHSLDHAVARWNHITVMVNRVYKELMLLGVISFGLFVIETTACLNPEVTHELHLIHLLLFYSAVAYIAETLFILYISELIAARWSKLERQSLIRYASLKIKLGILTEDWAAMSTLQKLCNFNHVLKIRS